MLISEVNEVEKQFSQKQQNPQTESQLARLLTLKRNEIRIIERNRESNGTILHEMKVALEVNVEQKSKLQQMLLKIHSSKRHSLLQTQIEVRNLRLDKADLHI